MVDGFEYMSEICNIFKEEINTGEVMTCRFPRALISDLLELVNGIRCICS